MTIVVYGPKACGKTRNAAALAAHFNVWVVVDDWLPGQHKLTPGALHLTYVPHPKVDAKVYAFSKLKFDPNRKASFTREDARSKRDYLR